MAQNDCENCHKKPKFGTHKYCSKTCASQAAASQGGATGSLASVSSSSHNRAPPPNRPQKAIHCIYCRKKPKFSNFDYCSKSCAALATTAQSNQATVQGKQPVKPNPPNVRHAAQNNPGPGRTHNARKTHRQSYIALTLMTDDSSDYPPTDSSLDEDDDEGTDLSAYPTDSEEEPSPSAPVASPPTTKPAVKTGKPNVPSTKVPAGTCAIPHCGKPVHMDKNGASTNYCSIKHREEAVTLKLKAPCILCKRYPQSDSDYFCSTTCRNQSMSKT
ncbi:hypothetical protein J3A83DRAFT_4363563 [Scleroderma citrinum]